MRGTGSRVGSKDGVREFNGARNAMSCLLAILSFMAKDTYTKSLWGA